MNRILTALAGLTICAPAMAQTPRIPVFDGVTITGTQPSSFPTATIGDNSTKPATTGFVGTAVGTETTRAITAEGAIAITVTAAQTTATNAVPKGLLYPRILGSGINPALNLAKFVASSTPTVCYTGDSTIAASPAQGPIVGSPGVTPIDNLSGMLTQRILRDNPKKTTSFKNFGIGAQTWGTLDGIASANLPPFYFDATLPWLPYIQAANCTSLYINMGVNDANGFTPVNVRSVLAKIAAWAVAPPVHANNTTYTVDTVITDSNAKLQIASTAGTSGASAPTWATTVGAVTNDGTVVWKLLSAAPYVASIPDLVLITNKNVNPANASPIQQTGTLNAASYTRNMAYSSVPGFNLPTLPPIGLIDIGRYFTEAYNGFDPAEQYMTTVQTTPVVVTSFPYTLPTTAGDYDLNVTIPAGVFTASNQGISFLTGTPGSAAGTGITFFYQNGAAYFVIFDATGQSPIGSYTAGAWNASGANTVEIVVRGERLYVTANGVNIYDAPITRFGGPFAPTIALVNPVASPSMTVNYYSSGTNRPYSPTLTTAQVYGTYGGVNGGNGINHDSSIGENAIDWAVLEAARFTP